MTFSMSLEIRRANWWKEAIALRIDALSAVQNQLNPVAKTKPLRDAKCHS